MIALNESVSPGRSLHFPAANPAARLLERARAALQQRRYVLQPECDCATCVAMRTQPYRCADCGFTGAPATVRCSCHKELAEHLRFNRFTLQQYPAEAWPADWQTTRVELVRQTAQMRRLSLRIQTIAACEGEGRGMPASPAHTFEGNCCHGMVECPACGGYGDKRDDDANLPLAMCRELNAILFPADLAANWSRRQIGAIAVKALEEDGMRWREVRSPAHDVDGQRVELAIAEDMIGDQDSYFLEVTALEASCRNQDHSFGVYLSRAELDWTIDTLVALRDRACAEGIIRPASATAAAGAA